MKNYFSTLLLAAILCAPFNAGAQVTIGSDRAPSPWSVLDLDNSERVRNNEQPKALHLPRMTDDDRDNLNLEATAGPESPARGLMIFNTDNECVEFWSGTRWISLCEDALSCGRNGVPIRVLIGENYYYVHYFMTNGVNRCWMVENSREGNPRNMNVTGTANSISVWNRHPSASFDGERGFYYVWATAHEACPDGWSVPSLLEFQSLAVTVNAMPNTADSPRRFWNQAPYALAGFRRHTAVWDNWDTRSLWWSGTSSTFIPTIPGGVMGTGSYSSVGTGLSVRCIRDE